MEKNRWDDQGAPLEQDDTVFVDKVIQQVQGEVGMSLMHNPGMSVHQIKLEAMHRFIDLINKELLTHAEAEKCYQRFAYLVDWHYGS